MKTFLSLVLFVGTTARSPFLGEDMNTVVVSATADTYLNAGETEQYNTFGALHHLTVGGNRGPYRALVNIPLEGVSRFGKLLSAKLEMSIFMVDLYHIRCTSDTQPAGCATAHVIQSPWGEGTHINVNATDGEASWVYSSFPTEWDSPGGDFDANPIGRRSFESEVKRDGVVYDTLKLKAEFPLDVNRMNQILEGGTPYFGFLLKDDEDEGGVLYESRECKGQPDDLHDDCSNRHSPRLIMEFNTSRESMTVMASLPDAATTVCVASVAAVAIMGLLFLWRRHFQPELAGYNKTMTEDPPDEVLPCAGRYS